MVWTLWPLAGQGTHTSVPLGGAHRHYRTFTRSHFPTGLCSLGLVPSSISCRLGAHEAFALWLSDLIGWWSPEKSLSLLSSPRENRSPASPGLAWEEVVSHVSLERL